MADSVPEQVQILDFPETRVAAVEHRGSAKTLGTSIRRFIEWRMQNDLPPSAGDTFNVVHSHPTAAAPDSELRYDLCVATDREIFDNHFGVIAKVIPAGRCAMLRHIGSDATLEQTVDHLYKTWLPSSRQQLRDFPLFFQRVHFGPDVPAEQAVTHVFLPIKTIRVRALQEAELPQVADLLAHALVDDAAYAYLFPDAQRRVQGLTQLFASNLRTHLPHHCTYVAIDPQDQLVGTVTLRPIGGVPISTLTMLRQGLLPFAMSQGRDAVARLMWLKKTYDELEAQAAQHAPHRHVHMMAVVPSLQGRGIGGKLLADVLDGARGPKAPTVLTTHLPRNVAFYGKLGFSVVAETELQPAHGAPYKVWSMRRD